MKTKKQTPQQKIIMNLVPGSAGRMAARLLKGRKIATEGSRRNLSKSTVSESGIILSGQEKELENPDEWEKKLGHWRNRRTGEIEMFDKYIDRA